MESKRKPVFRRPLRLILLLIVVLLVLVGIPFFLVLQAQRATDEILREPDQLLKSCHELITHRSEYRDDSPEWSAAYSQDDVILNPRVASLDANVPAVFRENRMAYIVIHSNAVTICISTLPKRYLLAFLPGATEYGDEKIVDGLWLSTGGAKRP